MARRVAWRAEPSEGRTRLDAELSARAGWLSRSRVQQAIRSGHVKVNGRTVCQPSATLSAGDDVESFLPEAGTPEQRAVASADVPVCVVHEDPSVVVVDKPAGITVHPGAGHDTDTLVNGLLARYPEMGEVGPPGRPGVLHRLDRDTSGLLVFARTAEAFAVLGEAMRERRVKRTYTALARGKVNPPNGTIDAPIGRDPSNRTRQAIVSSGRPARTHYTTIEQLKGSTLLRVELETGRMHQVRVQMTAIGHPLLGDPEYGGAGGAHGLTRQFLHASRLRFEHPESGDQLDFASPLPADLAAVLDKIRTGG